MRKVNKGVVVIWVAVLLFSCRLAISQTSPPAVVWEKQFPDSVDWQVSTSSGIVLVRSGNTVFALDGKNGQELWSLKGLQAGDGGANLLDIPGVPVLLAPRDEPGGTSAKRSRILLALDLRNGKPLCQLQGVEKVYSLVRFLNRERVLLVTGPDPAPNPSYGSFKPQLYFLHMLTGDPVKSLQFVQTSLGILPSCPFEWQTKYPRGYMGIIGSSVNFMIFEDQLYALSYDAKELARIDPQTGKQAWTFGGASNVYFADGKIFIAGKDATALEPLSGKTIWTAKGVEATAVAAKQGKVYVAGRKGAFALDSSSGSVLWRAESDGAVAHVEFFEKSQLLVFGDKSGLVVVDPGSGKLLWRIGEPLRARLPLTLLLPWPSVSLGKLPLLFRPVGPRFVLLPTAKGLALYDVTTGNELWTEAVPDKLSGFAALGSFDFPVFATKMSKNDWKIWRINPSTGQRDEWALSGQQPEFNPNSGLAYAYTGNTIRAFKLPEQ